MMLPCRMLSVSKGFASALFFVLGLLSCGEQNRLSGSYREVFSLAFDKVKITYDEAGDVYSIAYTRLSNEIACRLSVNGNKTDIRPNYSIEEAAFKAAVLFDRLSSEQPGETFGEVISGRLLFTALGKTKNAQVMGEFTGLFESGFTLEGRFNGNL